MRFVHFTDTHLGKSEEHLKERELDFHKAFEQVIDYAIEKKVDFVIHTGDIFDTARPSTDTLVFVVNQLLRLKEAEIPLFVTAGSHDIGMDGTIISVLDAAGLLKNLSNKRYYRHDGEKIIMSGEEIGNCFICGVVGRRAHIDKIYQALVPEKRKEYNIFMFHHIISDINEKFADIPTSLLPKNFDYYAGGHWHGYFEKKLGNGVVVYPGSTEFNDLKEMKNDSAKYFCLIETEKGQTKVNKIPIRTRQIVFLEANCNGKDSSQVTNSVCEEIKENKNSAILVVELSGRLKSGVKSEIDRGKIQDLALSKGYVYTKIHLSELENPETPFVSVKSRGIEEVEEEYLSKQGYDSNSKSVAIELIGVLGKSLTGEELGKATDEAIEIVQSKMVGELIED